jgi:hypothetical protein
MIDLLHLQAGDLTLSQLCAVLDRGGVTLAEGSTIVAGGEVYRLEARTAHTYLFTYPTAPGSAFTFYEVGVARQLVQPVHTLEGTLLANTPHSWTEHLLIEHLGAVQGDARLTVEEVNWLGLGFEHPEGSGGWRYSDLTDHQILELAQRRAQRTLDLQVTS